MIPMYVDYSLIGAKIKARRREIKLTQENLAETLSVSVGYVSQVERGVTKVSLDLLARIGAALDCDLTRFLSDSATSDSGYLKSELTEKYDRLSASQKRMLLGILDVMLKEGNPTF
ncbi:MAG: helix-turn-helix transcriptional regulator [Oscillospiraceae bacterium]|nr:helix-turn-helix transcriptional regulator [Oscillospiraceae bacterium]